MLQHNVIKAYHRIYYTHRLEHNDFPRSLAHALTDDGAQVALAIVTASFEVIEAEDVKVSVAVIGPSVEDGVGGAALQDQGVYQGPLKLRDLFGVGRLRFAGVKAPKAEQEEVG